MYQNHTYFVIPKMIFELLVKMVKWIFLGIKKKIKR